MTRLTLALLASLALSSTAARAQEHVEEHRDDGNRLALVGAIGWGGGVGVIYDRELLPWFGLRVGYWMLRLPEIGVGSRNDHYDSDHGPSAALVFKTPGAVAFEASLGATALLGEWSDGAAPLVLPDAFLGVNIAPRDTGLVVRAGVGLSALLAGPAQLSVGFRF